MKKAFLLVLITYSLISCTSQSRLAAGNINILPRSAWNAQSPRPFASHVPVRITVHHEGTHLEKTDDAAKKIHNIQRWGMGPDRNWSDIPYHFLIAPDGTIYQGRDVYTVGETATEYNPAGHLLITCLGNLEVQDVPEEQINSLANLIAWCSDKYKIPLDSIATHRDYSGQTTCPGKNLYRYFSNGQIIKKVKRLARE